MTTLTGKRNDWNKMLSVVSGYTKEARIEVDDNKAVVLAVDPAKVAIVKANIECEGDAEPFTINVEQCLKALNAAGGDDVVFDFNDVGNLTIIGNARVKMPLEADLGEIRDINRAMFDEVSAQGKIDPTNVEPCVSYGMWNKESIVSIVVADNRFKVCVGEDRHTAEVYGEGEGNAASKYPLDYFETMIKQAKGSEVTIKIPNNDYPMLAEWSSGTGEFSLVIAPRVEQE